MARLGGDEFAILQRAGDDQGDAALALADRLIEAMREPYKIAGHKVVVGTSIGIALAPDDGDDADQLLKNADLALYRAKSEGRNGYRFFEPADGGARRGRATRSRPTCAARSGATNSSCTTRPLINSGDARGRAASRRWCAGAIRSAAWSRRTDFIPLAEETGLIVPLGEWMLRQACADAAAWPAHIKVAVNLSPAQFTQHRTSSQTVARALRADRACAAAAGARDHRVGAAARTTKQSRRCCMRCASSASRIALDDFGTGYSSLSYLQKFPFDKIKIDRSFVRELSSRSDSAAIVRAVNGLGKRLDILTTAEGDRDRRAIRTAARDGRATRCGLPVQPSGAEGGAQLPAPRRESAEAAA